MSKDTIYRQAAIDAMFANMPGLMFNDVLRILRTLPSAQPERKAGRWEKVLCDHIYAGLRPWTVCCSECGMIGGGTRYCPNCGADMRGETDE